MINIENLEKVISRDIFILLKYGAYMSVSGILLKIVNKDLVLECWDNASYGNAKVLESESHVPISSLAV